MKRGPAINPMKAKVHRNYSIAEAAKLFLVHRNTVRAWIRAGLQTVRAGSAILILGCELRDFLIERQRSRRRPLGSGQLYCVKCREPRSLAEGTGGLVDQRGTTANVRGRCAACGTVMHRRISVGRLMELGFEVLTQGVDSHLANSPVPSLNCHQAEAA